MSTKISQTVRTPAEYRDVVDAAETLGLAVDRLDAYGTWETSDGDAAWPRRAEIVKLGRKYFHLRMDGRVYPSIPGRDAHLRVTLRAVR